MSAFDESGGVNMRERIHLGRSLLLSAAMVAAIGAATALAARAGSSDPTPGSRGFVVGPHPSRIAAATARYVILGSNDLGMHCYQKSYQGFMILPPGNNLLVQVLRRGDDARLVTHGIVVRYQVLGNTYSAGKTDFWDYAKDFGFDVKPNVGITGNGLKGQMTLSADGTYFEASLIPVTPYDDQLVFQPLQVAKVVVRNKATNAVLARQRFVLPVSDEMNCAMCHGPQDTAGAILRAHDENSGTTLAQDLANGNRHACSECHKDNALGAPGKPGVLPLSQAMHGFHADKMAPASALATPCYACHPGAITRCLRGAMAAIGFTCTDPRCHGDMANVAQTQAAGREAWLQEPTCGGCHGSTYAENPNTLYRQSVLRNGPEGMNGFLRCEDCHNSPHAEWPSLAPQDNQLPIAVQGMATYIQKCTVCHQNEGGGIHGNTGGGD